MPKEAFVHNTSYGRNSVHELDPLGRLVVHPPHNDITWTREEAEGNRFSHQRLALQTYGGDLWMPQVNGCNALVLDTRCAKDAGQFSETTQPEETPRIYGGAKADGLLLRKGSSAGFLTADCPTLVVMDVKKELLLAAHAGRDSLLDRGQIYSGEPTRENFSVIEGVMKVLRKYKVRAEDLFVGVYCGIGWQHFAHSFSKKGYKKKNRQLFSYLRKVYGPQCFKQVNQHALGIDLFEIIVAQLEAYGVKREQIHRDEADTGKPGIHVGPKNGGGRYIKSELASHRRNTHSRNFILVQHAGPEFDPKANMRRLREKQLRELQQLLDQ